VIADITATNSHHAVAEPVVPKIIGERSKILQILNNLFSNAKYALDQRKGELTPSRFVLRQS
jgi:nitrogen-specific signal transduction histidine kinase